MRKRQRDRLINAIVFTVLVVWLLTSIIFLLYQF